MMRLAILLMLAVSALTAQAPARADLMKLADQLEAAILAGDWPNAAQLSRSLKESVRDARNQQMAAAGIELTDSILTWLPSDTETLVVAQQPFTIMAEDRTAFHPALELAQSYVLGLLWAAEKDNVLKGLTGRTVRLAALAARRFGEDEREPPPDAQTGALGMIPYQGCAVYAFSEPVKESLIGRPPEDSIMGYRVWISKGSQNDRQDRDTYLVSLVKPDLMMVCNHREFFSEMVSRIGSSPERRALPPNLPEGRQVDRTAPLWAICHYRDSAFLGFLTPAAKDPGATGLTIEFGLASGAIRARVISKADFWKDIVGHRDFAGAASSRASGPGVWELSVQGQPEAAPFAVFALMAMLGFVVLI